jgi:hypothetical protein
MISVALRGLFGHDETLCVGCGFEVTENFLWCGKGDICARICRACLDDYKAEHKESIETTATRCGCNPLDIIQWRRRQ